MNVAALLPIVAAILISGIIGTSVAPSVIQQIKTSKVENQTIGTQKALFDAISRYITLEGNSPTSMNDLISKNYFSANSNNNGFGGGFNFTVDPAKGTVKITTEIADAKARESFIKSYKNVFTPIQGDGNSVDTTFILPKSIKSASEIMSGIPVQSIAPDASTNKYWYDTSGEKTTLKMSDGVNWKAISYTDTGSVASTPTSGGSLFTDSIDNLTLAEEGDVKYVYDSEANQIAKYTYYEGDWYNMGSSSSSYKYIGKSCDDGDESTLIDTIKEDGVCRGSKTLIETNFVSKISSALIDYLTVFKNKVYFSAYSSTSSGVELFSYDGENAPILIDAYIGFNGSTPKYLTVFKDKLYFSANIGNGKGTELCVYDGTNPVAMAADINPTTSSNPSNLKVVGDKLYFAATENAEIGQELYVYDGINPPTLVYNFMPGTGTYNGSNPDVHGKFFGKILVTANVDNTNIGRELYAYDETTKSISLVADLVPGVGGSYPTSFVTLKNKLYFSADSKIYTYDGINPPTVLYDRPNGDKIGSQLVAYKGKIYAAGHYDGMKWELFSYDGGTTTPQLVATIGSGFMGNWPMNLKVIGDNLIFTGTDANGKYALFSYNGSGIPQTLAIPNSTKDSVLMTALHGGLVELGDYIVYGAYGYVKSNQYYSEIWKVEK